MPDKVQFRSYIIPKLYNSETSSQGIESEGADGLERKCWDEGEVSAGDFYAREVDEFFQIR